jgi:tRNA G18 (ribose-2'-O)-methylase SpoU
MIYALLHNIRSIYNTASIFRTADGLGVDKLILSGYTPTPTDRFGRHRQRFSKVSLGAEETVPWEQVDDVLDKISQLQADGLEVLACEPIEEAADYRTHQPAEDTCLVFGSEPDGLPEEIITACNNVIGIPMQGEKSSLNVAVAFGVICSKYSS